MLLKCFEASLSDLIRTQEDMSELLYMLSAPMERLLAQKVMAHKYHENLNMTLWPASYKEKRITFRRNSRLLSESGLRKKMVKSFGKKGFSREEM